MGKIKDKKHANLMKLFIKQYGWFTHQKGVKTDVEYIFNYYGDRGSIDLINFYKSNIIEIYEFKTQIEDIGEVIRQLKRYEYVINKLHPSNSIIKNLVITRTEENLRNFLDNLELFHRGLPFTKIYFIDSDESGNMILSMTNNIEYNEKDLNAGLSELSTTSYIINIFALSGFQISPEVLVELVGRPKDEVIQIMKKVHPSILIVGKEHLDAQER